MALTLGELSGVINLDTAAFEAGLSRAEKKFNSTAKSTESTADKMRAAVEANTKKVAEARSAEEDAAGKVRVAEAKLAEARTKGGDTSAKVIAAAETLATAQRKLATASDLAAEANTNLGKAQEGLEGALKESESKLKNFGVKGMIIAAAAGAAIGAAMVKGLADGMEFEKANDKLAAQLGLQGADAEKAGKISGKLYAGAYGESMDDVAGAVGAVMSSIAGMRTASSEDITAITAKALDLAAAFDVDVAEAAGVAGQLIKDGLAADATEAMDLIADAMQGVPAAMRGEIFPIMSEYGKHFETMGIDGTTAFGIVKAAAQDGAIGMDKIGDAIKEFSLKTVNMDKPAVAAFEFMGLSATEMADGMAAGGEVGQAAFAKTIAGLQGIKDPANQAQAAIALFGTPLEDLGTHNIPDFLGQLDPMGDSFDSVAGAADNLGTTLNDNTSTNLETFKRGIEVGIADALNEKVIPALNDAAKWMNTGLIPALQEAGRWIQDNAGWLIPLTAGITGYVIAMTTMSIVSAVRGWIAAATAAQWGLNAAMAFMTGASGIGLIVAGIVALVAGLIWFFTQTELGKDIVANVWAFIQAAVAAVVDWFTNTALPIIQEVFRVVGEVFTWLYENIVRPAFEGISTVVNAAWLVMNGIFQLISSVITNVLAPIFGWLYENVIKPAFEGIGKAIGWVWDNLLKPIFDNWVWVFNNVLGPAFTWLYENVIKPAFDGIGKAIDWVWVNIIKPVFDTLSEHITKTIPKAFEDGVGFIKKIWDGIQEIAKAPIRFVIDTVINDGLIGAFNTIAGVLPGIDKLPRVALPPGFSGGGYTGKGGKHDPAGIVHAGEVVFSQDDIRRHGGVGSVEAMRRGPGFADGGRVSPLKHMALTQGYNRVHKGIDLAAAIGTPVYATENGTVSHAGPGARAPGVWGGNEVHINGGSGIQSWFAHLSQIGVALGQQVRAGQQIGASGNTGISSGPHLHFGTFAGGWPNDIDPNAYLGGAGAPSGGGFNPIAGIIDGLVSKFRESFPGGGIMADLAIGVGKKILDGATGWVTKTLGGGDGTAAGPTVYDGGGWLENTGGPQLVQHNKSKPDAVLSSEQWADIHKLALSGGKGDITYAPVFTPGPDFAEQERIARTRFTDALSVYA